MKGKPTDKSLIIKIMNLYGKGNSGNSIARDLGLSRWTVQHIISANSLRIVSRASVAKEQPKTLSKNAKVVMSEATVQTFTPFKPPANAPILNSTAVGIYRGTELSYRQPKRV